MIRTLHKLNDADSDLKNDYSDDKEEKAEKEKEEALEWSRKLRCLLASFASSCLLMITTYFIPLLASLPFMSWVGMPWATAYSWSLTPSLSYVGQGMIMGPKTGISMLLGAMFGWGLLAPIARHQGRKEEYCLSQF